MATKSLTQVPIHVPGHWIGGEVVPSNGDMELISPVDGRLVGTVPVGTAADVDRAAKVARVALERWGAVGFSARAEVIRNLARELAARRESVATAIPTEIGVPITFARQVQAGFPPVVTAAIADLVEEVKWEEEADNALLVREPVGVVGAITPFNFPPSRSSPRSFRR